MAFKPKVLILDEISVGSDCNIMENIWDEIRNINQTQIIISHNMEEVKKYSNKMILLKNGKAHEIYELSRNYLIVVYNNKLDGFNPFF